MSEIPSICVTGREPDLRALEARLEQRTLGEAPVIHELRLDALRAIDDDVFALIRACHDPLVVCCRPRSEGGEFEGLESDRLNLLRRAAAAGAPYLDVELSTDPSLVSEIRAGGSKVILSNHRFTSGDGPSVLDLERFSGREADVIKIAVSVDDAADLEPILDTSARIDRPHVVIGMGGAGLLSRFRFLQFGSLWSYVSSTPAMSTAAGQPTLETAELFDLPSSSRQPFYALLGGENVFRSPGPGAYNRLFRRHSVGWSYLPVMTSRPVETLRLLQRLGCAGVSVTMPHKETLFDHVTPDDDATAAHSVNTIRLRNDCPATNTDIAGVAEPLVRRLEQYAARPASALVLGAGGAARAAALACHRIGLRVLLSARSGDRAHAVEGIDGVVPWEERAAAAAEILINATPVGGNDSPWPEAAPLKKLIVFDLAIGSGSNLLERAEAEGAETIDPVEMWMVQGARQMNWLTGLEVTPADLRECLA